MKIGQMMLAALGACLAGGTPVHFLCYEFTGRERFRLEEFEPATGAKIA